MAIDNSLVYALERRITTVGSLGIGSVKDEGEVRFVIENASPSNVIRVRARIVGQVGWDNLIDLTGPISRSVNVFTYDQIEVIVLVYASSTDYVSLVATSFDGSGISFTTPDGETVSGSSQITFTSNDSSVVITSNPVTGEIDFSAVGGGGSSTPYSDEFIMGDWTLNVDTYEITYFAATHGKGLDPIISVFEENGADYDEIESAILINASGDITLQINSSPDLRFAGKVVIN